MKQLIKFTAIGTMALVILLLSSQLTQAQQGSQPGPPPLPNDKQIEAMVDDLSKELSLTAEQEKKVSEKYFNHFDEVKIKMESGRPDRKVMETHKANFEKDVKTLLTKEQQEKYDNYLKKNQPKPRR